MKNPVTHETYEERQLARVGNDGFEILTDGEWRSFEIKGFNINGEAPGNARYCYSGDYSYYASLLQSLGSMGGNCVRTYDLLPPEFYRALGEYNRSGGFSDLPDTGDHDSAGDRSGQQRRQDG